MSWCMLGSKGADGDFCKDSDFLDACGTLIFVIDEAKFCTLLSTAIRAASMSEGLTSIMCPSPVFTVSKMLRMSKFASPLLLSMICPASLNRSMTDKSLDSWDSSFQAILDLRSSASRTAMRCVISSNFIEVS